MERRRAPRRTLLLVATAWSAVSCTLVWQSAPAVAAAGKDVVPGVSYEEFDVPAGRGTTHAHLLRVDLTDPHVAVDLLHPAGVSSRAALSRLADRQGAVAGINGDFFNNNEGEHPGIDPTWAPVGPAAASGRPLKAAVPDGQRHGPGMPPGVTTADAFGVGTDGIARTARLELTGTVRVPGGEFPLGGLNQYALPENSVGAFTSDWGSGPRARSVCGTDTERGAPCTKNAYEVRVEAGRVSSVSEAPGSGAIPKGTVVLVGRESGADRLRDLKVGDAVSERHQLSAGTTKVPFKFALGGFPVLRDGAALPGLNSTASAPRAAAGASRDGKELLLLALDGSPQYRTGVTLTELAALMKKLGAEDAINLDGGGSSTMVLDRQPRDEEGPSSVNHPADGGIERLVPNGIGVFTRP